MIKIIGKEILFCKVCDQIYTESNKPYILNCGNTLCYNCVLKYTRVVLDKSDPSCHFDYMHHHILEDVPVNYTFLNIIQNFKANLMKKESLTEEQIEVYFKPKTKIKETNNYALNSESNTARINDTDLINFNNFCEFDCSFIQGFESKNKIQINGYNEIKCDDYTFKGIYKNGVKHGLGEFSCDEFVFSGLFENDLPCGKGTLSYKKLTGETVIYEGNFNGFKNGEGHIIYPNGDKYYGKWKNLLKDGPDGKYYHIYGDYCEGSFRNDALNGQGTYYFQADKRKVIGEWKNGKEDGEVMIYFNNSQKPTRMLYRNGVLITILEL